MTCGVCNLVSVVLVMKLIMCITADLSIHICSSVKTLLLERANVKCIETGEEKPLGAINCKSRKGKLFRADAVQP